jgi:hypothetical protein
LSKSAKLKNDGRRLWLPQNDFQKGKRRRIEKRERKVAAGTGDLLWQTTRLPLLCRAIQSPEKAPIGNMNPRPNKNSDGFPELLTEAELIVFLRIPEISKAQGHKNVVANFKRMHDLPCVHICKQPLHPRAGLLRWVDEKCEKERSQ